TVESRVPIQAPAPSVAPMPRRRARELEVGRCELSLTRRLLGRRFRPGPRSPARPRLSKRLINQQLLLARVARGGSFRRTRAARARDEAHGAAGRRPGGVW